MSITSILVCAGAIFALAIMGFGFLMAVGAVCSRAEDEYWEELWDGNPITETARDLAIIYTEALPELRKAA